MPTYLLTNEGTTYTSLWKMLETNPAYSTDNTTSVNSPKNSTGYQTFEPGVAKEVANVPFLPTECTQMGWRTDVALNGDFNAGDWTFYVKVGGSKYLSIDITMYARLWRSPNPDMSAAIAISDWVADPLGPRYIADKEILEFSWTWTSPSTITLSNEYLYVEFAVYIGPTASPDAAGATLNFFCDEDPATALEQLVTPAFTEAIAPIVSTQEESSTVDDFPSEIGVVMIEKEMSKQA